MIITSCDNYTIPSNNRELRLPSPSRSIPSHYTIPSNNRELRHLRPIRDQRFYYTIPSNNRELRRPHNDRFSSAIIPYQVITGNYDIKVIAIKRLNIIPYQVITGNYDYDSRLCNRNYIIPYQVITGNYDPKENSIFNNRLYHTK